ncbi:hypothetical protein DFH07DRAFT_842175 [Mycena maculata]|uniref:Uncharacterized protein n=1 Tax=Mycena maculata TaxID=230809 RepID=A0AAD7I8H8_9AGAR|nr:hypothetical protein DFH07DRAFT_842175 [Mycena maculata]
MESQGNGPYSASGVPSTRLFHFPSFPTIPDGVKIIPFKEFEEWGTRVVGADGVERDGKGIPTIRLPPKKKAKKVPNKPATNSNGTIVKREWWEEWEAAGEQRRIRDPYDRNLNRVDRLHQAVIDFPRYHNLNIRNHVQQLWEKWKNFAGVGTPASSKVADMSDDESDFEGEPPELTPETENLSTQVDVPLLVAVSDTNMGPAPVKEDDKAQLFLNDPARSVQVFLSSYMRSEGIIYDRRKLSAAPRLLRFFVQFLTRNAFLPECTEGLQEALKVIAIAERELPLLFEVSNAFPDPFSLACTARWGRKVDTIVLGERDSDADSIEDKRETKRMKTGHDADVTDESMFETARIEEVEEIRANNTASVDSGVDGVLATVDLNMNALKGSTDVCGSGWGDAAASQNPPDPNATGAVPGGWGTASGWGSGTVWDDLPANVNPTPSVPAPPALIALLGPTAFPLTHEPGVVEASLRRVKSITAFTAVQSAVYGSPAEAVECELAARMSAVVLAPCLGWVEGSAPRILRSSNVAPGPPLHDMLGDDITILVDPAEAKKLRVGMGLGATWVQLARVQKDEDEDGDAPPRYWYAEELVMVLPSYWLV